MVSILATELRRSRPFPYLNQSLVRAASMAGFDWQDDQYEYYRLFQARVFDDRRKRDEFTLEVAARFNSQIPLEYAYHVWGLLPDGEGPGEAKSWPPSAGWTGKRCWLSLITASRGWLI